MKRFRLPGIAALVCLQACAPILRGRTMLEVRPAQPDSHMTVAYSQGRTAIVEVTSPTGIGSADLTISGPIPELIVLRFQLRGLELVEVAYGQTTVTASLSSSPNHTVSETVRSLAPGSELPLSSDSPYWMALTVVPTGDSPATIPLQEGYIDVQLPTDLHTSAARTLAIRWIDFLR